MPFAGAVTYKDLPQATVSAWHVCVSMQRFSWAPPSGKVQVMESTRPVLPLTATETHSNIYSTCYELPQIEVYSEMELAGLRYAKRPALVFYLDGHAANELFAGKRKHIVEAKLQRRIPTSVRHCGNHIQNICMLLT